MLLDFAILIAIGITSRAVTVVLPRSNTALFYRVVPVPSGD